MKIEFNLRNRIGKTVKVSKYVKPIQTHKQPILLVDYLSQG